MALRLNFVFILAVICSIQICSAAILSKSYSHNDIHITLPLLFNEYDDVLSQYDGAKYLYPSSFALDDDNNIYIQYIFELLMSSKNMRNHNIPQFRFSIRIFCGKQYHLLSQ